MSETYLDGDKAFWVQPCPEKGPLMSDNERWRWDLMS
jgi:hypothetical protein